METRLKQLDQLHSFVEGVDKDLTLTLQNLQWDRKNLLSRLPMVTCRYNNNHKLPLEKAESHQTKCFMKLQGYSEDDELLPEPLDINANTLVKLSTQQIITILNDASRCDPMFKRGNNWESRCSEPWSLARLQATYTGDERRAIHNAVVQAVPSCHDLADLALPGCSNDEGASKVKSRVEILAELRDMRRRRTKYRQAAKTRNYSDVLRDVIKTQMESYSGMSQLTEQSKVNNSTRSDNICIQNDYSNKSSSRDRETYIPNKNLRGECSSKYYKSHTRETNRYNSSSITNYNSKRIQNSRNYNSERHNSYSHEKFIDRDKISTKEKAYEYDYRETRDKNTSSSYRRYEDKDRSERNIKETQTRNSYKRKRNRDSYTSDEFKDSRTTDRESKDRRKSRRDERSPSYNNTYRSRVCIKKERLESPERSRSGKTRTPPAQKNNRHSELYTDIKQERLDSPDYDEKRDYGNTSRQKNDTNIKVEKIETPDSRHNYSRSECGSPDYTEDREDNITIKRENDRNTDKRIGNKQRKTDLTLHLEINN
ncbi:U11/U12 small nuclear ribonucleoprotein 48 kDa protein [Papilio machaon]|uniref:U11/U12 small nuclear ribonucleoprotein 48 kDa protein n=1 Tax=Papilio machaon TaxID=76193 RepID=A0A0N1PHM6_PAPMA|nr:U11/U12 small nuclear ribonucleoprotein 48 kDa protein [Papilio machaon]